MKLTLHFEDGTKQSYQAPEWARWVEVTKACGEVWAWDKEPVKKYISLSHTYSGFSAIQPNKAKSRLLGYTPETQRGQLELSKIQFHR